VTEGSTVNHLRTARLRTPERDRRLDDETGSLVTEYGLIAVLAATIAGVVISWASNGALVTLFNALLRHARGLVGA
jgi:Flp pilus assembly pilin Flp